jgi:hypothetical protein
LKQQGTLGGEVQGYRPQFCTLCNEINGLKIRGKQAPEVLAGFSHDLFDKRYVARIAEAFND